MIWIVFWSSWLEMIRSWPGPKKVSSSKTNGMRLATAARVAPVDVSGAVDQQHPVVPPVGDQQIAGNRARWVQRGGQRVYRRRAAGLPSGLASRHHDDRGRECGEQTRGEEEPGQTPAPPRPRAKAPLRMASGHRSIISEVSEGPMSRPLPPFGPREIGSAARGQVDGSAERSTVRRAAANRVRKDIGVVRCIRTVTTTYAGSDRGLGEGLPEYREGFESG